MPYHIGKGDQELIVFEDENKDQIINFEIVNHFPKKMKFSWATSFDHFLKIEPRTGVMEAGEKINFILQFYGSRLCSTDIMDFDHKIKLWWTPYENRKRTIENTEHEVPVIFAVHVNSNNLMDTS